MIALVLTIATFLAQDKSGTDRNNGILPGKSELAISRIRAVMMNMQEIQELGNQLARLERVLIITGAGLSAGSGIPTYRGLNGLYNGVTEEGIPIEQAISGPMLKSNPGLCWKYLIEIGRACLDAEPNPAHYAIARFLNDRRSSVLLTQNIDGLHAKSGCSQDQTINIHGTMNPITCMKCSNVSSKHITEFLGADLPPRCNICQGVMRPSVVLYEEMLGEMDVARFNYEMDKGFQAVVTIGTTGLFPYISYPSRLVAESGGLVIEVNTEETNITQHAHCLIKGKAEIVAPILFNESHQAV